MRRVVWVLAWIGVAIWSLFAWGAYGLLGFFGDIAVRNADIVTRHPETVEWLSWALATLRGLGLAAVIIVWGLVSLLILGVAAILGYVLGRSGPERGHQDWRGRYPEPPRGGDEFPPPSPNPPRRIERR